MIFAKPSHLCTTPESMSKAYNVRMWRLVLNDSDESIRMTMCRPTKRQGFIREDCPWSIAFEKDRHWRKNIKNDDFLFLMVAGLHEQLPIRNFSLSGRDLSRFEPRFEDEQLQQPPKLTQGRLELKKDSGRLIFTPVRKVAEAPKVHGGYWWLQGSERNDRTSAFAQAVDSAGFALASGTRRPKSRPNSHRPPPLAAPPPAPWNPIDTEELIEPEQPSVPQQAGPAQPRPPSALWQDFWNGHWITRVSLAGLPVANDTLTRIPSLGAVGIEARHPLWSSYSVGLFARYEHDREGGELLVNTALKRETQFAIGERTTLSAGVENSVQFNCADELCSAGLNIGYRSLRSRWSYDAEKTTLNVWTPTGGGLFLEPWFRWRMVSPESPSGWTASARYTDQLLNDTQTRILSLEGGWHWGESWTRVDLGAQRISGWDTSVGLRIGTLKKTGTIRSDETGTSLDLTGFWLKLTAELDEVVE